ncbi:hypothetical protein ACFLS1_09605 [Verrucomicrobiota bacterium]
MSILGNLMQERQKWSVHHKVIVVRNNFVKRLMPWMLMVTAGLLFYFYYAQILRLFDALIKIVI